jgi:hypothetical protein
MAVSAASQVSDFLVTHGIAAPHHIPDKNDRLFLIAHCEALA